MLKINKVHHIAIICSNYERSKKFYVETLELEVLNEVYREARDSYKLDLALNGEYIVELFYFPNRPKRPSFPEAQGLRHLAFEVDNVEEITKLLKTKGVECEPIRTDETTGKKFTFFQDPDELPLEIYQK